MKRVFYQITHVTKNGVNVPCSDVCPEMDFPRNGGALVIDGVSHPARDWSFHETYTQCRCGADVWQIHIDAGTPVAQ